MLPSRRRRPCWKCAATLLDFSGTRWFSWQSTKFVCKTWMRPCADILRGSRFSTEKETLDLTPHQVKQAEESERFCRRRGNCAITGGISMAFGPDAEHAASRIEWQSFRLSGSDALAVRASKKLKNDELLITSMAGTRLRMDLDKIPLWRGNHVPLKQLAEDFARYLYLPRVSDPKVIIDAASDGLSLLTWEQETFAYADSFDDATGRYRGLRLGQRLSLGDGTSGLLVKAEAARKQTDSDNLTTPSSVPTQPSTPLSGTSSPGSAATPAPAPAVLRRFHGSITLDPTRLGRDAGRVADEVVSHLAGLIGAGMTVTLEIDANFSTGVPEKVVRIVIENCRTLKFTQSGFEEQ